MLALPTATSAWNPAVSLTDRRPRDAVAARLAQRKTCVARQARDSSALDQNADRYCRLTLGVLALGFNLLNPLHACPDARDDAALLRKRRNGDFVSPRTFPRECASMPTGPMTRCSAISYEGLEHQTYCREVPLKSRDWELGLDRCCWFSSAGPRSQMNEAERCDQESTTPPRRPSSALLIGCRRVEWSSPGSVKF